MKKILKIEDDDYLAHKIADHAITVHSSCLVGEMIYKIT